MKTRSEINETIAAAKGEKLCGNYHERHTGSARKIYVFVNALEERLLRMRLKKFAIILIASVLFLTGCIRRHVKGKVRSTKWPESVKY